MIMNIDIVIATSKNIESSHFSICYTIRSILYQSINPVNIFIVLNGGIDKEKSKNILIERFGKLIHIIETESDDVNISKARNTGAKKGCSDIIIFLDDDVVLGNNYILEKIKKKMKYNDFLCGAKRFWSDHNWYLSCDYSFSINHICKILKNQSILPLSIERASGRRSYHDYSFIGHCGAIKRHVFEQLNGFDESYEGWLYQDTDLMMRLCVNKFNYELLSDSDIYIYHLSHPVDKEKYRAINEKIFLNKQKKLGIKFYLNHFFGIFSHQEKYLGVIEKLENK